MANKWFAAFLGFLSPPLAFVYLSRFRMAVCYLAISLVLVITGLLSNSTMSISVLSIVVSIAAIGHSFVLAKSVYFSEGRFWYNRWWGALSIPLVIFFFSFIFRSFAFEVFTVSSGSMSPTLEAGDKLLVKKWGYGNYGTNGFTLLNTDIEKKTKFKRGEISILTPPHSNYPIIARVVGLPGDSVKITGQQLAINGELVATTEVENGVIFEHFPELISSVKYENYGGMPKNGEWRVPDDHYFVMGDNRNLTLDSRTWGSVPVESFSGRYLFKW